MPERASAMPHKEVPQQRNLLASIDPMEAVRKSSALLGRDMEEYRAGYRLRGEVNKDRDVMIYALWETGLFSNEQIGRLFGITYSAVSHVIAEVKGNKSDPALQSKLRKINAQFKICPEYFKTVGNSHDCEHMIAQIGCLCIVGELAP